MKSFLVDESVAWSTIELLRSFGHGIESVRDVDLFRAPDEEIANYAVQLRAYPDVAFQINALLEKGYSQQINGLRDLSSNPFIFINLLCILLSKLQSQATFSRKTWKFKA